MICFVDQVTKRYLQVDYNPGNRPYSVKRTSGIFAAMATIVPCM